MSWRTWRYSEQKVPIEIEIANSWYEPKSYTATLRLEWYIDQRYIDQPRLRYLLHLSTFIFDKEYNLKFETTDYAAKKNLSRDYFKFCEQQLIEKFIINLRKEYEYKMPPRYEQVNTSGTAINVTSSSGVTGPTVFTDQYGKVVSYSDFDRASSDMRSEDEKWLDRRVDEVLALAK